MRNLCLAILALSATVLPLEAGETAWQELAPGVMVRLISAGEVDEAGKAWFALELDMPEDTRTYWRVPGEAGLPTELDFSGSSGIAGHTQHWPTPERDEAAGYLDYA